MIQGHGDDIYNYKDIRANFSSNINPEGINPALISHLYEHINAITNYPSPLAENLRDKISELKKIQAESILVTNGAVEAFYLIASLRPGASSVVYIPSFSEYEDACKTYNHKIEYRNNNNFSKNENFINNDMVWLGNPNNPDGKVFSSESIKELTGKFTKTIFVIDEAYIDFIANAVSFAQEASQINNLVVVSSLTKKYVIPGLRLGYLIGHPNITEIIKHKLMPWRISSLAIEAGLFCLSDETNNPFRVDKWLKESKRTQEAIDDLEGFNVLPSETTFFLVKS
ncbi:MAG: aminotransferase class I/II-fold pyridoxal phosphate-dependent enzyme, partial [Marinilabiliaceae bacterium]|nr:aminotransferase class I/II-fold pyridoxal phosphate-dependent enzyme [Marinilabiliaceae bacterium]